MTPGVPLSKMIDMITVTSLSSGSRSNVEYLHDRYSWVRCDRWARIGPCLSTRDDSEVIRCLCGLCIGDQLGESITSVSALPVVKVQGVLCLVPGIPVDTACAYRMGEWVAGLLSHTLTVRAETEVSSTPDHHALILAKKRGPGSI